METQILKLNEPYEYIYCNGSIGLHIATMIVYEAKVNNDGEYVFETHSHPVVKYENRPGGTVWNRAELTDCHVLCREDKIVTGSGKWGQLSEFTQAPVPMTRCYPYS